jgi:hypothetical protein
MLHFEICNSAYGLFDLACDVVVSSLHSLALIFIRRPTLGIASPGLVVHEGQFNFYFGRIMVISPVGRINVQGRCM